MKKKSARVFVMNPDNPQRRIARQVADVLNDGGVIIFPTDTVYAIGASIKHPEAIERLRNIKSIDKNKYLSFILKDLSWISDYVRNLSNSVFRILKRIYPGPYTSILEASKLVPKIALNRQKTVGIRIPSNPIALLIVEELGHPIVSTSVHLPEGTYLDNPQDIIEHYGDKVDVIVDGGIMKIEPSTVIDFTKEPPEVLRYGKGPVEGIL